MNKTFTFDNSAPYYKVETMVNYVGQRADALSTEPKSAAFIEMASVCEHLDAELGSNLLTYQDDGEYPVQLSPGPDIVEVTLSKEQVNTIIDAVRYQMSMLVRAWEDWEHQTLFNRNYMTKEDLETMITVAGEILSELRDCRDAFEE